MPDPETRASLLWRLRNPEDQDAWDQFAILYRPVVFQLAIHRGMRNADAEDLAQQSNGLTDI
jgi:RNA polymerase sigma-70 factor (ECF subfamily)